ncbi:MAG TPA: non-homologous end-joining DNA ligase, partial [Casimicrobiaceae bacterium]|nr:non-homologous end-joining DNA ligase [Casimicrobiaceae bacterium]
MALEAYRAKRDFRKTPEPRGEKSRSRARRGAFVVQKHAARQLHYDFRLELDGVLVSWAVPKGPSLDPADKRLAMHVEDHPLEYAGFEGVIPAGEYGGGTVMVWDKGSWTPRGDPVAGYRSGHLTFTLHGEKLQGNWALIRTRNSRYGGKGDREAWLLIKEVDEFAQPGSESIVDSAADSVVSGRSIAQIAQARERVWRSKRSVAANVRAGAIPEAPAPRRVAPSKPRRARSKTKGSSVRAEGAPASEAPATRAEIAGVALSNPDKLYFPEAGLTKRDLALYYEEIAPWILPHIMRRPLSLVRCPDGWSQQCFYQKHADKSVNDAVTRVEVPENDGAATYFSAGTAAALVGLVQWGVIELHPWGARAPRLERPDQLIFDFDPDENLPWETLVAAVRELRTLLAGMHLTGFLKTTGGKGLHVVLPIRATLTWDDAKSFTKSVADSLVGEHPDLFTATAAKEKRKGKIFIDYLRNASGATAIAPYAVRARANAPVATPIAWSELAS